MEAPRIPSWKKPRRLSRRRKADSPYLEGRGLGGEVSFPRAARIVTATRQRTARELWDLVSPTSAETASDICLAVSRSKNFVRRLQTERPPSRARWRKALSFSNLGAVIALMYAFYLLVALAITLPVLFVAFCLDCPPALRVLWRRLRRTRKARR